MRSLIIAPQWIGDAVMTEPLLRLLAKRGEKLTVFAVPWVAPIYRAMQHIDGLQAIVDMPFKHGGLQWQARRGLAARIRSGEWGAFDKAYVLPNSLKSALVPWLAGIPTRIGYKGEQRFGLLNQKLPNPSRDKRDSMVSHYLALSFMQLGEAVTMPTSPKLSIQQAHHVLEAYGLAAGEYTVIAPGAEYGPAKRWPTDHFAQLAAKLKHTIVLLGSAKEALLCEAIRDKALQAGISITIVNLAGQTTLLDAIQIIANAKQMVSNDSGLMHVGAAFGIPQVAIFGSSDPRHTPPLSSKAKVLWLGYEGLACTPCFERECPKADAAHLACMKGIEPTQVVNLLQIR